MSDELNPIEENALDVLLSESIGNSHPPDLSNQILARLHDPYDRSMTDPPALQAESVSREQAGMSRQFALAAAVITALAASVLLVLWLRFEQDSSTDPSPSVAVDEFNDVKNEVLPSLDSTPSQIANTNRQEGATVSISDAARRSQGIPLVMGDPAKSHSATDDGSTDQRQANPEPPLDIQFVSTRVDEEFRQYWNAIGIEPAEEVSADEVAKRLSIALGVELSADVIGNPSELQLALSHPDVSQAIALRWLKQITENGVTRVAKEPRATLVSEVSDCFQSKQPFDRALAGWVSGQSENASTFFAALASGQKNGNSAMVRRLAALTMNIDLRCTRCHDAYIEGSGRQEDYWAFAALLSRGVKRGADGKVKIDSGSSNKPFFFELPDGRQRLVEPMVAAKWMSSSQAATSVRQWAQQLSGSPALAQGVVNSLWEMVHGRPLRGRVVDPISAPHNESLVQLEAELTDDLIRSRFDVARTLSLIITSPTTRRAVAAPLLPENALVAKEADLRAAMNAVDAFAAAMPTRVAMPMSDRVVQAERAIGVRLETSDRINAQVGPPQVGGPIGTQAAENQVEQNAISADFPTRADSLPIQWLGSIKGEKNRIEHLGYLAGVEVSHQCIRACRRDGARRCQRTVAVASSLVVDAIAASIDLAADGVHWSLRRRKSIFVDAV